MGKLLLALLFVGGALMGCGGDGGGSSSVDNSSDSGLPVGCVSVGSVANSGNGNVFIQANCTNGTGNTTTTCFPSSPSGEATSQVSVPCSAVGAVITNPTPTP